MAVVGVPGTDLDLPPAALVLGDEGFQIHFRRALKTPPGAVVRLSWTVDGTRYTALTRTLEAQRGRTVLELRASRQSPAPLAQPSVTPAPARSGNFNPHADLEPLLGLLMVDNAHDMFAGMRPALTAERARFSLSTPAVQAVAS